MKFVAMWSAAFLVFTAVTLVVVGYLVPDRALEPPHPERCDCLECGRRMVDRYLKKHEATVKREHNSR